MCVQVDVLLRFMSSGLLIDTHGLSTDTRSGAVRWCSIQRLREVAFQDIKARIKAPYW